MSAVGQTGAAADDGAAPDLPPIGSRERYDALIASRRHKVMYRDASNVD